MPARNIKSYIAVAAAAAVVGLGAAVPAAASADSAAAPPGALATGSGGGPGTVPLQGFNLTQVTPAMSDDPHTLSDDGTQPAVLCATAIEYGLIAAL
jgi:Flp pilus assembly pilin Flp